MLHGAPIGFVVVGTYVHYEDRLFIPIVNELFRFHKEHEKLFTNVQAVNNIALIQGRGPEYQGLIKLLSEEHIMYDIINPEYLGTDRPPRKIEDYDLLILGDIRDMNDDLVSLLDNYVHAGGKLLATGATSAIQKGELSRIRLQSLGVESDCEIFPQSQATYLKVSEGDRETLGIPYFKDFSLMMMNSNFMKCKLKNNAKGYLRLLPSNMYGPAEKTYYSEDEITDYPGAVAYSYGKGKTVYIPWMLGSEYNNKGNYAQRNLFLASLKNILNVESSLETDGSASIEMTHLANLNGAFEWVGLINHTGFLGNSVREAVPSS
jgi:hypothetical protein